jgi:tetratricopeptide (TPR) repeat protein
MAKRWVSNVIVGGRLVLVAGAAFVLSNAVMKMTKAARNAPAYGASVVSPSLASSPGTSSSPPREPDQSVALANLPQTETVTAPAAAAPPPPVRPRATSAIESIADLVDEKKYSEAMNALRGVADLQQDNPRYWTLLGRTQEFGLRNYDVAEDAYRRAIKLKPNYSYAHERLGWLLAARGRGSEAIDVFRAQAKIDPAKAAPYRSAGIVSMQMKKHADALVCFNGALRIVPADAELHLLRGQTLLAMKRDTDAMADFQIVLATRPKSSDALTGIADVHLRGGRVAEAREIYQRVLRLDPANPRAHLQLGVIAANAGDAARAKEEWTLVAEYDPDSDDAKAARAWLSHLAAADDADERRQRATVDLRSAN